MDHAAARALFADIQQRPYRVSTQAGVPADNCFFKGMELLQKLAVLGYTVRGRIGETYWDTGLFPADIVALAPQDIVCTHFYPEIMGDDGQWRIADPSFQPALAQHGFTIGSFDGTPTSCFPITRLYSQEESIAYQLQWQDERLVADYFERSKTFLTRLNDWLATLD